MTKIMIQYIVLKMKLFIVLKICVLCSRQIFVYCDQDKDLCIVIKTKLVAQVQVV